MSFYEEPAVYEYGRTAGPTAYEGTLYKEKSIHCTSDTETEADKGNTGEERTQEKKNGKRNLIGLVAAVLIFGIICGIIWYLQPEGSLKAVFFGGLAADGIILLLFLWKLTAVKDEKRERQT